MKRDQNSDTKTLVKSKIQLLEQKLDKNRYITFFRDTLYVKPRSGESTSTYIGLDTPNLDYLFCT